MTKLDKKKIMEPFDIRFIEKFSIANLHYFLNHCYCDGNEKIEYVYCSINTPKGRTSIEVCTDLNPKGKVEIFDMDDAEPEPEPIKINREQLTELLAQSTPAPFAQIDLDKDSSK